MNVATSGQWNEERLYVLQTLEDLKKEAREEAMAAAVERAGVIAKAEKDIANAHIKIRKLEGAHSWQRTKLYITTAVLSVVGAIAFELFKKWLGK
jgi:uncharacterized protein YggE